MKRRRNSSIFLLTLVFLVGVFFLVGGCMCELGMPLRIENRTDMVLTIYIDNYKVGEVEPNESTKIGGIPGTQPDYLIEAENSEGEKVYSREFSLTELHDMDFKVVIPPPPE